MRHSDEVFRRSPLRSRSQKPDLSLEAPAGRLRDELELRHRPHGTILDPIFESPKSPRVDRYTRGGDSAIWTGHYLAAEAYRWAVTQSPDALSNIRSLVGAIGNLVRVTGTGLLARVFLPADSPWLLAVREEELRLGAYADQFDGRAVVWIGNTSRDQYLGVFFGLSVAFEHVSEVRGEIRTIITEALEFLLQNNWAVRMPSGETSTVFWQRVDQRLALLQVGRQVNDDRFSRPYRDERFLGSLSIGAPIVAEVADAHSSYFKFNLVAIGMFCLIRSELSDTHRERYLDAYRIFRRTTDDHGNAHFNLIDRAVEGPDSRRDAETRDLLARWLRRPRRDWFVDLRDALPACGDNRACSAIPVESRVNTDFLWQRSPFQLSGGGGGFIETAGIDFLLPYWMGRYYSVLEP